MQRVATELFQSLQRQPDLDVTPVVLRTSWSWTHIKTLPFLLGSYRRLQAAAVGDQVDVVLFSSMVTASLAVPLRKVLTDHGVLAGAIVHGRDVTLPIGPYQSFVPRVFGALDLVIPVSQATADQCRHRGLTPEKIRVIPNGIDRGRFNDSLDRDDARTRLAELTGTPLTPETLLLCSVGRQVERKGFHWFAGEVMPLLPARVSYLLAGSGPENQRIRDAIEKNKLQDRVHVLGSVSEEVLHLLYRAADLYIMPNIPVEGDMEGFGVVILEAGLNGLPTIASRLEGIVDVVSEGRNGHLVPARDPGAFARAIWPYYEDRRRLRDLSRSVSEYVAQRFGWDSVARTFIDTLNDQRGQLRPVNRK